MSTMGPDLDLLGPAELALSFKPHCLEQYAYGGLAGHVLQ